MTGFAAAFVESPMDNIKSKMQVQYGYGSGTPSQYKSSIDCGVQLVKRHGFLSLYQVKLHQVVT